MKVLATIIVAALFLFDASPELEARSRRVGQLPNGGKFECNTCHTNGGGSPRNSFGLATFSFMNTPSAAGNVEWVAELAMLDSDNDGFTNGEELQDALGEWRIPAADPGMFSLVSNPGSALSVPGGDGRIVTVNLSGFDSQVGRWLEMRLVDVETGEEVTRTRRDALASASMKIAMRGALDGKNYFVDFYVDGNDNQSYDAPTTDEAWRINVDNVTGDVDLNFSYNMDYTDINWGQIVSVNERTIASGVELFGNTPNPVNDVTRFNFSLERPQTVRLQVLGARGDVVATVAARAYAAGEHQLQWSAAGLTPGVYYYRLEAGNALLVRRMLVIR